MTIQNWKLIFYTRMLQLIIQDVVFCSNADSCKSVRNAYRLFLFFFFWVTTLIVITVMVIDLWGPLRHFQYAGLQEEVSKFSDSLGLPLVGPRRSKCTRSSCLSHHHSDPKIYKFYGEKGKLLEERGGCPQRKIYQTKSPGPSMTLVLCSSLN